MQYKPNLQPIDIRIMAEVLLENSEREFAVEQKRGLFFLATMRNVVNEVMPRFKDATHSSKWEIIMQVAQEVGSRELQ